MYFLLLLVGASAFIIQLFYYLFFYIRLLFYKNNLHTTDSSEPVSVVISARNESKNLTENLSSILEQSKKNYQVVVVNDASTDFTGEVLAKCARQHEHLYITQIPHNARFSHGKKLGVTVGIKAATNELLLFTDADCQANKDWVLSMQSKFDDNIQLVLGYGAYKRVPGLLNYLIRFDTFFIGLQYLSFALAKTPYMGVGRNLAYRRSFFFEKKGFAGFSQLLSGDDDLFVNKHATSKNTAIEISPESITYSEPKHKFSDWISQKRRHSTTFKHYKTKHKLLLGGEMASRIVFYAIILAIISITQHLWMYAAGMLGFRFLMQAIILGKSSRRLHEKGLLFAWIFLDILIPLINFIILFLNIFVGKKKTWN